MAGNRYGAESLPSVDHSHDFLVMADTFILFF